MMKKDMVPDTIDEIVIETRDIRPNISLDDIMYLKHLKQRRLFVDGDIAPESIYDIVSNIFFFNAEDKGIEPDKRTPIKVYITSNGGDVDSGYELIDAISSSITPVYTINLGYEYSMAFLIGLAGHKRYATKHARFLMHDGASFVLDSTTKAQDRMDFMRRVEKRTRDYVLSRSKITPEEYDKNARVEWYMFSDEAKERGFVDYIIGEDCAIDEII